MIDHGYDEIMARAKAAADVQVAWIGRDEASALNAAERLFEHDPRPELEYADPAVIGLYKQVFESFDEVVCHWWLADEDGATDVWRNLMLPAGDGSFSLPNLICNASWLRRTGSERVDGVEALPPIKELERMSLAAQARVLGRFCMRADATTAFDYAKVAQALDPRLLPFLATWFLDVYLISPGPSLIEGVLENRSSAVDGYLLFHGVKPVELRVTEGFSRTISSLHDTLAEPRPMLEALVRSVQQVEFGERIEPGRRRPLGKNDYQNASGGTAVLLNGLAPGTRAARCIATACEALAESGSAGYLFGRDTHGALQELGAAWNAPDADIVHCNGPNNLDGFADVARAIAARGLELFYSPAAGGDALSSWLSSTRLARVQATGYGTPTTTGSAHMDYFVGGAALEIDPTQYCERLVLLPGYGMLFESPSFAPVPRARPLDDEQVLLINTSPLSRLHPELLRTWSSILQGDKKSQLEFHPELSEGRSVLEGPAAAGYLEGCDALLVPSLSRAARYERLCEADLYMDNFPIGDFEMLVDALLAGLPVITLEGRTPRSRLGASLIRRLALPDMLIATSREEYVATARELINDTSLRLEIRSQLTSINVLSLLNQDADTAHFAAAIEWMRREGPRTGSKAAPVYIEAGCAPRKIEDLAEMSALAANT